MRAIVHRGYALYLVGGWLFAFLYFLLFGSVGVYTWWFGALAGFVHGLFLLMSGLPLLPFIHPRMASEYHGATALRQLEPPVFVAMNYGYGTPVTTLLAQVVYGAVLGAFVQLQPAVHHQSGPLTYSLSGLQKSDPDASLRLSVPESCTACGFLDPGGR